MRELEKQAEAMRAPQLQDLALEAPVAHPPIQMPVVEAPAPEPRPAEGVQRVEGGNAPGNVPPAIGPQNPAPFPFGAPGL